jgi:hypothetical protein
MLNKVKNSENLLIIRYNLSFNYLAIVGKYHYLLYFLALAIQPRMLVTFDESLRPLPVPVRVGQVNLIRN